MFLKGRETQEDVLEIETVILKKIQHIVKLMPDISYCLLTLTQYDQYTIK